MLPVPEDSCSDLDGRLTVLYAGRDMERTIVSLLDQEGGCVTTLSVSSASEGLETLVSNDVDCVVTEYDLPDDTGTGFLAAVAEIRPDLPFVLITSGGAEPSVSEVVSVGLEEYFDVTSDSVEYSRIASRIQAVANQSRDRKQSDTDSEWFQALVDGCPYLVVVLDDDGVVNYVSRPIDPAATFETRRLTGSELFDTLVHPAEYDHVIEEFERIKNDPDVDTVSLGCRVHSGDSSWRYVTVHVTDRRETRLDGFVVTVRSIFDWGIRERRSESRNELIVTALDSADLGVWEYFVSTGDSWCDDQTRNVHGLPADADVSVPEIFESYHPDDQPTIRDAFDRAVHEAESFDEVVRLDGDEDCWVRVRCELETADGEVLRLKGSFQDITDLKQREKQFEALHTASQELMQATSRKEIAQITVQASKNVLGYVLATVRLVDDDGEALHDLATTEDSVEKAGKRPDYRIDEDVPASRSYREGEPILIGDLHTIGDEYDRGELRSGMYVPIGDRGVLSVGDTESGAFDETDLEAIGVLTKLSSGALSRIESERKLREKNQRLEEFAGIVAHDLRNPLTVAHGYLAVLSQSLPEEHTTGSLLEHIERIESSLVHMETLIDEMLSLTRKGRIVGDSEAVDLDVIARRAWDNVETVAVTLSLEEPLPTVEGDGSRIEELFENLFRNAVEHAGDDVTITVGSTPEGFFVEDDGIGISSEETESVFEAGYTTASSGTGYGLYIVHEIAQAHGWSVDVVERTDGGARFEFRVDAV